MSLARAFRKWTFSHAGSQAGFLKMEIMEFFHLRASQARENTIGEYGCADLWEIGSMAIAEAYRTACSKPRVRRKWLKENQRGHPQTRSALIIVTAACMTNGQKSGEGPQQRRQRGSRQEVVEDEFLVVVGGYQLL